VTAEGADLAGPGVLGSMGFILRIVEVMEEVWRGRPGWI
jgi:hypothetical protein